jgi:hypothetical protein
LKLKFPSYIFIVFSLFLGSLQAYSQEITRAPYLQMLGEKSVQIRYRTNQAIISEVQVSSDGKTFNRTKKSSQTNTEHLVLIDSLTASNKYFYRIRLTSTQYAGDSTYFFKTAPTIGSQEKFSVWSIGDMYPDGPYQKNVYEGFKKFIGNKYTNLFLTVGDNVYGGGTDDDFQKNFFQIYQNGPLLKQSALFPSVGNHDYDAYPKNQDHPDMAYYQSFTLPTKGELGGLASGSEAYYSFDYGNTHFICLDSYAYGKDNKRIFDGPSDQLTWLKNDLKATKQKWKVVFFHYPPYTKGTYDSDSDKSPELINLRAILPKVFDEYNVDLVLTGHSHVFERSKPLKNHYGLSSEFNKSVHWPQSSSGRYDKSANSCPYLFSSSNTDKNGVIYVVNGVGGGPGTLRYGVTHPVMEYSLAGQAGSFYFEIDGNRLDAKFINEEGNVLDQFTVFKDLNLKAPSTQTINYFDKLELAATWTGEYVWSIGDKTKNIKVNPTENTVFKVSDPQNCFQESFDIKVNPPLSIQNVEESINIPFESLSIYDLLGRKTKEFKQNGTINKELISELNPGLHILIYQQNGQEKSLKIRTNSY